MYFLTTDNPAHVREALTDRELYPATDPEVSRVLAIVGNGNFLTLAGYADPDIILSVDADEAMGPALAYLEAVAEDADTRFTLLDAVISPEAGAPLDEDSVHQLASEIAGFSGNEQFYPQGKKLRALIEAMDSQPRNHIVLSDDTFEASQGALRNAVLEVVTGDLTDHGFRREIGEQLAAWDAEVVVVNFTNVAAHIGTRAGIRPGSPKELEAFLADVQEWPGMGDAIIVHSDGTGRRQLQVYAVGGADEYRANVRQLLR